MKHLKFIPMVLDLQLFAEGGDGGTGAEGATGVSAPAAEVQTTGDNTPAAEVKDRNAEFEALIKGEYKDLYDARVQNTIQQRLKGQKETVDKYNALAPTLEMLAKKYGVDIGDIVTAPADVVLTGDLPACEGEITIHEGKFHQIKRMFHAVGSEITYLERIRFGGLSLDESLCRGEWRYLTSGEEAILRRSAGRNE